MTQSHRWRTEEKAGLLFLLLCLFGNAVGCSSDNSVKSKSTSGFFQKSSSAPLPVTAYVVNTKEVPLLIKADGKTQSSDRFEAKAPSPIKIQKIFVEEGARVQPGDPLIKFSDEEERLRLTLARAQIKEAEAGLDQAGFLDKNREQLIQEGKMSELEAQGISDRLNLYQTTLDRARAEVDLYEKLADSDQLNSPIAGIVTKREVAEGSSVTPDQKLIEVVKVDPILFIFSLPADQVTALEKEKNPTMAVRFSAVPGQDFTGEVASVGVEAKGATGIEVKLKIPNPDLVLKADMRGSFQGQTESKKKIMTIPESAIVRTEHSTYVYKIQENKLKKIPVDLGDSLNANMWIVDKGLNDGDSIVAVVDDGLKEGSLVEVETAKAER